MADVLKRLYGPGALANTNTLLYTVPSSTIAVIRGIHVANETATPQTFTLSISSNDQFGYRIFAQQAVQAFDSFDWTGNIVLSAAETLYGYANYNGTISLIVSGLESS